MCGIAGLCAFGGSGDAGSGEALVSTVRAMSTTLAHRGPDGEGIWASSRHPVCFGHRRLAIIDLSENGNQPMVFGDAGLSMVYNGELYNTEDLRKPLLEAGYSFRGHSDTEVVLRGYQHWGDGVFERLAGMFALVILDENAGELVMARDRCGQKPLYIARDGKGLAFASEVKALHPARPGLGHIDEDGLADFLAYGYALGPHTLTAGVQKIEAGTMVRVNLATGAFRAETFWTLPTASPERLSEAEAEERFETLLEDAVRRHLVSDVPVGVLLSGGIDSSLVTAMAARAAPGLKTFSVTFPGQGRFDEAAYAREIANHFGTEHVELEMADFTADTLQKLAVQFDDPIADHAITPSYLLASMIREHVTVALGGDGGDELFGGYPHYGIVTKQAALRRIPGFLRAAGAGVGALLPAGARGRNHLRGMGGPLEAAIARINLYFDAEQRGRLLGNPADNGPERRKIAQAATASGCGPVEQAMACDFHTTMAEGYMTKIDRAAMLASLETRAPILDNALVDFAWRDVPVSVKFHEGRDKILPRRLAARLLPTKVADKKKQGFTMPLDAWLRSGSVGFFRDILLDSSQTLFDHEQIERLFALQDKGYNNSARLFALAMASLWSAHYGMRRA